MVGAGMLGCQKLTSPPDGLPILASCSVWWCSPGRHLPCSTGPARCGVSSRDLAGSIFRDPMKLGVEPSVAVWAAQGASGGVPRRGRSRLAYPALGGSRARGCPGE
jgi:hypothetical protein